LDPRGEGNELTDGIDRRWHQCASEIESQRKRDHHALQNFAPGTGRDPQSRSGSRSTAQGAGGNIEPFTFIGLDGAYRSGVCSSRSAGRRPFWELAPRAGLEPAT